MKQESHQMWKKVVSMLLVLCMVWSVFGQYLPYKVTQASSPTASHTVTLTNTVELFLSNKNAASGPVTLSYTVESATTGVGDMNNGISSATNPAGNYPYTSQSSGRLLFENASNQMMVAGRTYVITMNLDNAGALKYTINYTDAEGTGSITLPYGAGTDVASAQYFGIWLAPTTTAKLTNVTCVDANGNNLGLQVNSKNSSKCTIEVNPVKYEVTLTNAIELFLSNKTAASGPVTLRYTVESATTGAGDANNGISATTNPTGAYPYTGSNGKLLFENASNQMMVAGRTYAITMSLDNAGVLQYTINYTDAEGTGTITLPHSAGTDVANAQHFGIWLAPTTTAKLTNVTFVDGDGYDLGLQVNDKNSSKCTLAEAVEEEPEEPVEPVEYTVTLTNAIELFLSNKIASGGPVTLSYTVESATIGAGDANNGISATTNPTGAYPYTGSNGKLLFENASNKMMVAGRTYQITMDLDNAGVMTYTIKYTDAQGSGTISLPYSAGTDVANAQYFGIWLAPTTTAKLTNVTFVDASGNDLGLQANKSACVIEEEVEVPPEEPEGPETPVVPEASVKYSVTLSNTLHLYLSNKTATNGPVILRYTVDSATVTSPGAGEDNNGVAATTDPSGEWAFTKGMMWFENASYPMMVAGRTYTIIMNLDSADKLTYTVNYTDAEGAGTITLPNASSEKATGAQYFGIYISPFTTAKLTDVSCIDAEGNDLGLQVNNNSLGGCSITTGEAPEQEELTPFDDSNAVKYSMQASAVPNLFFSNEKPANGAITLRYTVDSQETENVGNNGVVVTTKPDSEFPYHRDNGSMFFTNTANQLLVEGRAYTLIIYMTEDGKVRYEGSYTDAENESPVSMTGLLPNATGNGAADAQYFGIYTELPVTVTLSNVSCVDKDGNDLGLQGNHPNCIIVANATGDKAETLDSSYTMITLGNFGVPDGTYYKFKQGAYALSMHKKVFSVDIVFSESWEADFRYGGQINGYHGLQFWTDGNFLYMKDITGKTKKYTFVPVVAGTNLVGTEINMKLSTEYVDSDGEGIKNDVKLGVWFNDKLYNNEYIYLKDYKDVMGKHIGLYSLSGTYAITVKGVAGVETGVDYTIFGFTKNWRKEMGIE